MFTSASGTFGELDAIGAVTFYPVHSFLLSISGSRNFDDDTPHHASSTATENDSDVSSDSDSDSDVDGNEVMRHSRRSRSIIRRARVPPHPTVRDASIKLWDFGVKMDVEMAE